MMTRVVLGLGLSKETRLIPDNVTMEGVLDQFDLNIREWYCSANGKMLDEGDLDRPLHTFAEDSKVRLNADTKMEAAPERVVTAVQPDPSPAQPSEVELLRNVYGALMNLRTAMDKAAKVLGIPVPDDELPF